jgi:hypothetical protein
MSDHLKVPTILPPGKRPPIPIFRKQRIWFGCSGVVANLWALLAIETQMPPSLLPYM